MDRFEELKNKYRPVLDLISREGVKLAHLHLQDNKLIMQGAAPSQEVKNDVWNQIKAIDPKYSDLTCDLSIDPSLAPRQTTNAASNAPQAAPKTYKVQSGDTLSKISKQFYGDANQYNRIFEANRDKLNDPNKIQVGQELVIP